jgi:hypothetical protein
MGDSQHDGLYWPAFPGGTKVGDPISGQCQRWADQSRGEAQGRAIAAGAGEGGRAGDECFWPFTPGWCPEPDVGRVVDGSPNRVDRIRLLGNGVVPQTACKAWMVLDQELREGRKDDVQLDLFGA